MRRYILRAPALRLWSRMPPRREASTRQSRMPPQHSTVSSFVRSFSNDRGGRGEIEHASRVGGARHSDEYVHVRVGRYVFDDLCERRAGIAVLAVRTHNDEPGVFL